MTTIAAIRFMGDQRMERVTRAQDQPAAGSVRVRVRACCLCGSDLRPWRQGWPVTPGHEIAGVVDQPGHALHRKPVAVYIPIYCGACAECEAGDTHLCRNMTDLIGWQRHGGYAEALDVPERNLIALPENVPLDLAPLLLDTIGTVAHGLRLVRPLMSPGRALVLGAGPIGLGAVVLLQRFGFESIDVVEPMAARRAFAAELGARPIALDQSSERYPLIVEASGKAPARQAALERVAPKGVVLQLGEAERWDVEETKPIRRKDFFYVRSFYFPIGDVAANIELFRQDRDRYARFVDERVGLQGLPALFDVFARGERIKPALVFEA